MFAFGVFVVDFLRTTKYTKCTKKEEVEQGKKQNGLPAGSSEQLAYFTNQLNWMRTAFLSCSKCGIAFALEKLLVYQKAVDFAERVLIYATGCEV